MAEMDTWNEFKTTVTAFLPSVEKSEASTVEALLIKGDNNASAQTKVTSAIKLMLEDYDNCPIVGRRQAISGIALTTFNEAVGSISAFADIFDSNPALRGLLLPHGRSPEKVFENGEAFVSFLRAQMRRNAVSAVKGGWDGSADSIVAFHMEGN